MTNQDNKQPQQGGQPTSPQPGQQTQQPGQTPKPAQQQQQSGMKR